MASCELSIELDDPARIYASGERIEGHVSVRVDKDVKCNGLRVETGWETHGKGNVARDKRDKEVVFQGDWRAGETNRYRFSLRAAHWPPTYHGKQLHIDHYVYAQADIPWAIDPKAKQPFRITPSVPEAGTSQRKNSQVIELKGGAAWIAGGVLFAILSVLVVVFVLNPIFALFGFGAAGLAAVWWFFAKFLPKWKLGNIVYQLETSDTNPGAPLQGELTISPKGIVPINGIAWRVKSEEVCVRGSGTNKRTYREKIFEQTQQVSDATSLTPNQRHRFPLMLVLPENAPYSVDLNDNDLVWTAEAHVDIPRWPDWKVSQRFLVVPDARSAAAPTKAKPASREPIAEPGVSFRELVGMMLKVRQDFQQLDRLIEGVSGLKFDVEAHLERQISVGTVPAEIGYPHGIVVEARHVDPHLPLLLYARPERTDDLEQRYGQVWSGNGAIVGYDRRVGSLQIRVLD